MIIVTIIIDTYLIQSLMVHAGVQRNVAGISFGQVAWVGEQRVLVSSTYDSSTEVPAVVRWCVSEPTICIRQ
jgi:hypothetical protein